jgi:glucokinase
MQASFPSDKTVYLGIDIGGTKCAAIVGTAQGEVLRRSETATSDGLSSWPSAGQRLLTLIEQVWPSESSQKSLVGIGVSCGGPLDPTTGTILSPPNLPGWADVPLKSFLHERFSDVPVEVENDANATALAEGRWGAGRGLSSFAYLTCGTGIGAGLILDGKLYRGKHDLAGEIGHAVVIPNGPLCQCGKKGCLEAVASGSSIGRIGAKAYGDSSVTGRTVIERARLGEQLAIDVLLDAAFYLGIGIANLLQTLDLERVIIGSLAAYAGEIYLEKVRQTVIENAWESVRSGMDIIPSGLGSQTQDLAALAIALSSKGDTAQLPRSSSGTI